MKKYILPLLCSSCLLHAEGQPSATAMFDQLLPAATPTVSSKGSLAEQHPSLAAIPADADLCLNLSQLSKSHAALTSYIPALAGDASLRTILHGIDDLSLALGKDGVAQVMQLIAAIDLSQDPDFLSASVSLSDGVENPRVQHRAYCSALAQRVSLPDIIISAQLKPELMARAKSLLALLPSMITPELSIPLAEGISLTDITLTQIGEHQAIQSTLSLHGHKKNYTILCKMDGDKLTLIGSTRPESYAGDLATENSLLASPQAQQLPADRDMTLLLQDRDTAMDIADFIMTMEQGMDMRWGGYDEENAKIYALLRAELPALLPYFEQGLQASLTLSPTPELELSWQDARYRFIPTATKALPLISESKAWIESSAAQFPDFATLLNQVNSISPDEEGEAVANIISTLTGQFCAVTMFGSRNRLRYFGIKDKALAHASFETIAQQTTEYVTNEDGELVAKKAAAGEIPENITLTDHAIIDCWVPKLQKAFEQAPAGPVQAGILLRFKLGKNLPPFSFLYGRLSSEGKTHTVKLRLTQ